MNEQESLQRKISAAQFSMLDLHLYLDSHPGDCNAAAKLEEARKNMQELVKQYEASYGPMNSTQRDSSRWAWISDPWPWDI